MAWSAAARGITRTDMIFGPSLWCALPLTLALVGAAGLGTLGEHELPPPASQVGAAVGGVLGALLGCWAARRLASRTAIRRRGTDSVDMALMAKLPLSRATSEGSSVSRNNSITEANGLGVSNSASFSSSVGGDSCGDRLACAVCLEAFADGDVQRTLPCFHVFHRKCVDGWLVEHNRCPTCRHDVYMSDMPLAGNEQS